jgi:hypothetical protein
MYKDLKKFNGSVMTAITLALFLSLFSADLFAATYYVDPNLGSDSNTGQSGSPKLTIAAGIAIMTGGDTLILNDGTYTGTKNMIGLVAPRQFPPSGIDAAHPTTIRAAHVGSAIIDANYTDIPFSNANQTPSYNLNGTLVSSAFIHVDGIHFRRGNVGVFEIKGHYHKITNCGFEDGQSPSSTAQLPIADIVGSDSSYVLFEDCWAWGKGRYGIYFGGSSPGVNNSIFRRCVVRQDDAAQGPIAGIMFYNGHDNLCQNCIVLDSTDTSASEHYGAFSATANYPSSAPSSLNNQVVGSIGLNNAKLYGYLPQMTIGTLSISNTVLWGNKYSGVDHSDNTTGVSSLNHMLIGANGSYGIQGNSGYLKSFIDVTNSIIPDNALYGIKTARTASYINTYGNGSGASGGATITNGITSNPFDSALKYLQRIEPGSNLKGAASDGGDIGANIVYQIGAPGSLYGDANWNTVTQNPLWPLANEAIWSAKIKSYTASGPGGNRGFAAVNTSTPLTDYIWGYLGNTVPPFNVQATSISGGVALTWNAASVNANLSGYKVYLGTSSGVYTVAGYQGGKDVGNVTSTVLNGLQGGQTYYIAVTTVDSQKGESGFSYEIAVNAGVNAADTIAPTISFSAPANNSTLTGIATVHVTAIDNVSVTKAELYIDGILEGTDSSSPYLFSLDTTKYSSGSHTLTAKAYDAALNIGQSVNLLVTVENDITPPTVALIAPVGGATIGGNLVVTANASDDVGVTRVDFYLNGVLRASGNTAPYGFNLDTSTLANGTYTFYAIANDAAGHVGESANVAVNLFNDTIAPSVSAFAIPATATTFVVSVSSFTATDNVGVTGYLITESAAAPTAAAGAWTTTAPTSFYFAGAGTRAAYAWAKDAAGNVSASRSASVTITLPDTTAPAVSSLTMPATATALSVSISGITATDNVAVTGYLVSENSTAPTAGAAGWSVTAPASFTFAGAGSRTAYAWAKDAAGNVSASRSASVTITVPDVAAPAVSTFGMPATATALSVSISGLTATDNVAVSGYLISESATAPVAGAAGWTATAPVSFTFAGSGTRTAYAWAKDAAGNVSASRSASVTITLADTTAPSVSAFALPATAATFAVPVSCFSATDNFGVTGYLITESATAPTAAAGAWTSSAPTSFTFAGTGSRTAYAWAKDAAGNVSASSSASILIDNRLPTIRSMSVNRGTSTVTIKASATDNIAVTKMQLYVDNSLQLQTASGSLSYIWAVTYKGTHTVTVKAYDAAGNVRSQSTSITK